MSADRRRELMDAIDREVRRREPPARPSEEWYRRYSDRELALLLDLLVAGAGHEQAVAELEARLSRQPPPRFSV